MPDTLWDFSTRALHDVISLKEAKNVAKTVGATAHLVKGARGLVGSLAAMGAGLDRRENTFEIIAYRTRENWGTPRRVDLDSVRKMAESYTNRTFHNVDPETGRVLVCPHGPDPVLLGVRGKDPRSVLEAFREVKVNEQVEKIMIFRTNQGTDAHLTKARRIAELEPHQSAVVTGRVETVPRVLRGGHVVFGLSDETGLIDCAVYAPTGLLNKGARELLPGDRIRVYGGIRSRRDRSVMLNLERLDVVQLTHAFRQESPHCSDCGSRCESMGKGQGFRCKRCGLRLPNALRNIFPVERKVSGAILVPPPRARRHLSKPHSGVSLASPGRETRSTNTMKNESPLGFMF
jgi:tRNA(Ile2)-agmatinylcytidine synthase